MFKLYKDNSDSKCYLVVSDGKSVWFSAEELLGYIPVNDNTDEAYGYPPEYIGSYRTYIDLIEAVRYQEVIKELGR